MIDSFQYWHQVTEGEFTHEACLVCSDSHAGGRINGLTHRNIWTPSKWNTLHTTSQVLWQSVLWSAALLRSKHIISNCSGLCEMFCRCFSLLIGFILMANRSRVVWQRAQSDLSLLVLSRCVHICANTHSISWGACGAGLLISSCVCVWYLWDQHRVHGAQMWGSINWISAKTVVIVLFCNLFLRFSRNFRRLKTRFILSKVTSVDSPPADVVHQYKQGWIKVNMTWNNQTVCLSCSWWGVPGASWSKTGGHWQLLYVFTGCSVLHLEERQPSYQQAI